MQSFTDFDVLRKGQTEYVTIYLRDPKTDEPSDVIGTNSFSMIDITDDSVAYTTTFTASGSPTISHPSIGVYQYSLNSSTYSREYLLSFRCALLTESLTQNVFVKSVSAKYFAYAAALRVQVDKARKSISDDIANMDLNYDAPSLKFFYGYDDKHLIYYLERGVQIINAVPPYTSFTVDNFPFSQFGTLLLDAATIAALESQGIFSIDTDFNYSLGGNSMVIDHSTKLSSFLTAMLTRFDKAVISMKQAFRARGLVMFQWTPGGVRTARMLNSMPSGYWSRLLSSVNM